MSYESNNVTNETACEETLFAASDPLETANFVSSTNQADNPVTNETDFFVPTGA